MADIIIKDGPANFADVPTVRYKDQGDGTTAQVVYVANMAGGGGGAATIADGADVAEGATTDAVVAAGAAGTVSAKLRRLTTDMGVLAAASPTAATTTLQTAGNTSLSTIAAAPVVATAVVKAASTAPVASDPALVVALSPNSPVVSASDIGASGTISALNANLNSGTPTANSFVSITGLNSISSLAVQIPTNAATATLVIQATWNGTDWTSIPAYTQSTTPAAIVQINPAVAGAWIAQCVGATGVRVCCSSYTSGSIAVNIRATTAVMAYPVGSNVSSNIALIGGSSAAQSTGANGATGASLSVYSAGPLPTAIYSAQNWAAISGSGATVTGTAGTGAAYSFVVNVTALTLGSSTGLDVFLQWSPDSGTTFYDMYHVERITATGQYLIPAMLMPGRFRMRWAHATAAATTATVTVTANALSIAPSSVTRQYFDRTAGVLSGTASSVTPWFDVAGCRNVSAFMPLGVATGPATYQLQFSSDGVNALPGATPVVGVASSTTAYLPTNGLSARFVRLAVTTAATSQTAATTPIVITGV